MTALATAILATCAKCLEDLDVSEFRTTNRGYRHSYCKECDREICRAYRKTEAYRQKRVASAEANRARALKAYHSGKKKSRAGIPVKHAKFHNAIERELRRGTLVRATKCRTCPRGAPQFRLFAWHHNPIRFDESEAWVRDVAWLCRPCLHTACEARRTSATPAPTPPRESPTVPAPTVTTYESQQEYFNRFSRIVRDPRPTRSQLTFMLAVTGDRVAYDPDWEPDCE